MFTGSSPRYRCYPAADGRLIAVAALEDKFWAAFCGAIGLADDLRGDSADPHTVMAVVGESIAAEPSAHWRAIFERADCCAAVVAGLDEALADPQFAPLAKTASTKLGDRVVPALPMPFASLLGESGETLAAPELGEANAAFGFPPLPG